MKSLSLVAAIIFSTVSYASTLDCKYQIVSRSSSNPNEFEINKSESIVLNSEKRSLVEIVGNLTNKKYTLFIDYKNMVNGTWLYYSLYKNFKQYENGYSGLSLVNAQGLFGADQKVIMLQSHSASFIIDFKCNQN